MRILTAVVLALLASRVEAAQPTLTVQSFTTADTSDEAVSVTMTAGQAVLVVYLKNATNNRTVMVTDNSGSNAYDPVISTGNCATARCVEVFGDYSVSGGTYTVTVDQSGALAAYRFWILQFTCGTSCSQESSSFLVDTATTSHNSSADATVIDTVANTTLVSACVSTGAIGTETPGAGWEALTGESDTVVFGQFEDDLATAFTNERGAWTSGNSVVTACVIFGVNDDGGGGGAGAGSGSGRLTLLGVG